MIKFPLTHFLAATGASPQNLGEITEVNYVPQKSPDYNFECLNSEFGWKGRVYWKHNNFAIPLGYFFHGEVDVKNFNGPQIVHLDFPKYLTGGKSVRINILR